MAFMNWSSALEVGHPKVDEQHKSLVKAVNDLHDAMKQGKGKDELGRVLHFLADYTATHFQTEEGLMQRGAYPGYSAHKAIHEDLLKQVADLVSRFDSGQSVMTIKVMDFLNEWLVRHILGEDVRLAKFLGGA
ncbi:MAG TPA: bacteriohemerythrin [Holophaga sp.]|nr:bacteriohemerythrin [Holophaga sp.]